MTRAGMWTAPLAAMRISLRLPFLVCSILPACSWFDESDDDQPQGGSLNRVQCAAQNGGIVLPEGFCASVVADRVGRARQMTVTPSGDLYVAINDSMDGAQKGHVLGLRDANDDGIADEEQTFGDAGGTGIAYHDGKLYFAQNERIVRWSLPEGKLAPDGAPEAIVVGLPDSGDHPYKAIVITDEGEILLNIGSPTNSCQATNRKPHSPGKDPCPDLETRAGIWRFASDRPSQKPSDGVRVATGLRNTTALALAPGSHELWGAVNGRD